MHRYYCKKYFKNKSKSYFTGVIFLPIIFFSLFGFAESSEAAGAAITYPALKNTTPSAGDYIRISIGTSNMTNKKLYISIRYRQ